MYEVYLTDEVNDVEEDPDVEEDNMPKQLYLIRGLPGAGKSTLAATIADAHGICEWLEADDYFLKDGEYVFDATKLHQAHKLCLQNTEDAMAEGWGVVVSNTFTTEKEMKPYLALAEEYGYAVTSIIVENRRGGKSVHNVPQETIDKMRARFSVKL